MRFVCVLTVWMSIRDPASIRGRHLFETWAFIRSFTIHVCNTCTHM